MTFDEANQIKVGDKIVQEDGTIAVVEKIWDVSTRRRNPINMIFFTCIDNELYMKSNRIKLRGFFMDEVRSLPSDAIPVQSPLFPNIWFENMDALCRHYHVNKAEYVERLIAGMPAIDAISDKCCKDHTGKWYKSELPRT